MREIITIGTHKRETLVDVTEPVKRIVSASGIRNGIVTVYAQGATTATMIQENWDESVQTDVLALLHDQQDGNGDAHFKTGLVGPSETIPIIDGQ